MHERLFEMAREIAAHGRAGTLPLADEVLRVPASNYTDPARWRLEIDRVFKRLPLMLALSAELPRPGDYKALTAVDVPVLLVRGDDGTPRAFVNACRHRGARVVPDGTGTATRFVCPYHAWRYDTQGGLAGIYRENEFGTIDHACHGLVALPCVERAGFVWVTLRPDAPVDIDVFLAGYDALLAEFGLQDWHYFASRTLAGPNWKIAYDGYLDFYHLPILHRNTFGPNSFAQAIYHAFGPHQRVSAPNAALADTPPEQWKRGALLGGVWTIFPHISIAGFDGGGRGVLVSQLFPGATPDTSVTVQHYLLARAPEGDAVAAAHAQFEFLGRVVRDEDYATGIAQNASLASGALPSVLFGRNEGGGQRFHGYLDALVATPDEELEALLRARAGRS